MTEIISYNELIKNGTVITDLEFEGKFDCTRIRKIRYRNVLYHLKTVNGKIEKFLPWDGFAYNETVSDIKILSDMELLDIFMFSDRDRKTDKNAERIYWMCVHEINERNDKND